MVPLNGIDKNLDIVLNDAIDWAITPTIQFQLTDKPTSAPEPASLTLLGTALVGLGLIRRRRKRAA